MRADIVTARAAVAHAAWHGRTEVTRADIRAAARLALPHRRRRNPFDAPGLDEDQLDQILGDDDADPEPEPRRSLRPDADGQGRRRLHADDTDARAGHRRAGQPPAGAARRPTGPDAATAPTRPTPPDRPPTARRPRRWAARRPASRTGPGCSPCAASARGGGTPQPRPDHRAGRTVGADRRSPAAGPVHLPATMRAAAPHQAVAAAGRRRLRLSAARPAAAVTEGRESNLVLFCVDASGSMAARQRMAAVKTAVLSLLLDAYQRRDKVGLVTFRGDGATLALPPTSRSTSRPGGSRSCPSGGRTPLAEGLLCAAETLRLERIRDPRRRPLLVWSPTAAPPPGRMPLARSRLAAAYLRTRRDRRDRDRLRDRAGSARPRRADWPSTCRPSTCRSAEVDAEALAGGGRHARDVPPTAGRARP